MKHMNQQHSFNALGDTQTGATLIVVLMVLILILVAGAIALRKSGTDLKVATSDQMDSVLLQSSESANQKLEQIVNGNPSSREYKNVVLSSVGALGYFINDPSNMGDEFVYCFDTRANQYLRSNAKIWRNGGALEDNGGVCGTNGNYRYTSNRNTVVTQMNITLPKRSATANPDPEGFAQVPDGGDASSTTTRYEFDMYATSMIPAYGNPGNCLDRIANNGALVNCMASTNTPHKTIYQQAIVEEMSTITAR